ncbi:hypothetical protein FACS1894109_00340 [Spirochaetia bacterium]|nr:hypothetical protein FACS1894109_00340 [Spirochaetia bacterium]
MKKRRLAGLLTSLLPGALILSVLLIGISGCSDSPPSDESQILSFKVVKEDLSWTGEAIGTDVNIVVQVGVDVDLAHVKTDIQVSPGASISPSADLVQDFSAGPIDYVVTAEDGTTKTTYVVSVKKDAELADLEITTPATKTVYNVNEKLDLSGLELTGTWADETTQIIENYTVSPVDMTTVGRKTVRLTANKKSVSFDIDVIGPNDIRISFPNGLSDLDPYVYNLDPLARTNYGVDFVLSVHDVNSPIVSAKPYPRERNISVATAAEAGTITWKVDGKEYSGYPYANDATDGGTGELDYTDNDDYLDTDRDAGNRNIITIKAEDYSYNVTHILSFTGKINGVFYSKNITFKVIF